MLDFPYQHSGIDIDFIVQLNFYKLNHNYPEKNFNLQKLQVKEAKPDRISLQDAVAVLQLVENSSNRSSNYRSSTVLVT